jgi:antitoxin component of MazEF toxin-antitoxin module
MAIAPTKVISTNIRNRSLVKLPTAVIEELGLNKGSTVTVTYGKNYTAVIILPSGIKLNDRMQERISILVNEQLG